MVDIYIIEDNVEITDLVVAFLKREGFTTKVSHNGREGLLDIKKEKARLLLLDIMLPDIDGFAVLNELRDKDNIPVIIMSALNGKDDKMNGFSLGADDYIEKPIDIDILIAKIKALFKRYYDRAENDNRMVSGALTIDKEAMVVYKDGAKLPLTIKEYELLCLLANNAGKTLNKDFLFNKVWGTDSFSENQTLTVHIKMLRDKIEEDPKNPERIVTVWGVGYRYEAL